MTTFPQRVPSPQHSFQHHLTKSSISAISWPSADTCNTICGRCASSPLVLLIAAIAVACFPLALQFESDRNLAATTATTAKEVAGWPYPQAEDKLTAARAYNKKLAESSQPILGEAVDPFAAAQGGSQASGEDSASKKDKEYQSLLNTGNGVMGTIKVPKQSINPADLSRHFRGSTGFWCRPFVRHVAAGGR